MSIVECMYEYASERQSSPNLLNVCKPHSDIIYDMIAILYQEGREDNPLHTDAFNELIENLKEKNLTWNTTETENESSVSRTLFMEENSDGNH